MLFSKDIDLSASKSRAIIDAVRCVEVFCGEPQEVLSIKSGRPVVHKRVPDAMVHIGIDVLTRKGLFTLALRLVGKRNGAWRLESGWMTFGEYRYLLRGHYEGYPSHSPELMIDAVSVVVIGVEGKNNHAIFGTSWIHRIIWHYTSGKDVDGGLFELFRAKG